MRNVESSRAEPGERTVLLLERARHGDRSAVEVLFARYLPRLRRWASVPLPRGGRDHSDTHVDVQETLLQTCRRVESLEARREGAFQAYLPQAVLNQIRDELRRHRRRPESTELDSNHPA